ncbi:DNA repair protein rad52 [Globomyces sp. JEL0801]|nr:DNA repair protein rad52 [Globomyces sp. JEL0801]
MDIQDTKPKKESYFGNNPYEKQDQDRIAFNLSKELGPEFLTERKGPAKLKYVEGWKLVNLANNILDFNGWSSEIIKQTVDYVDVDQGKYSVGVSTIVRVTLKDGAFHEDVGYGSVENSRSKSMAFDKSKKESVTDGIKRALKHFGNSLGNCVYNQDYLKRMSRMPVPKTVPKSNNELYHFNDVKIEPVKLEPIKQTTSNNIVDEYDDGI